MKCWRVISGIVLMAIVLYSCTRKDSADIAYDYAGLEQTPAGFPDIPFPAENPYSLAKWKLGKMLFYDNVLSVDKSINCGSCHRSSLAFSDDVSKSLGAGKLAGRRNAPSLANVAYHPYYTREGGIPTLEMQILVPIQEHDEFNFNIVDIAERLNNIPEYVALSKEIFGREPDPYVITRAIATFERTLISGNSIYDRYAYGAHKLVLTKAQVRGMDLFFSTRANCSNCHSGFNFTDYSFKNNGLYEEYADIGRERLTGNPEDNALFKVPSLRNVELTAPYMHDGSQAKLEDVVEHYNSGGKNHPHKSVLIKPLGLTPAEKSDLVAFLKSLTDQDFATNKTFEKDK